MSFLFRWGMIGLGGFLLFGGINEAINGERVSEVAEPMTPSNAASLSSASGRRYIEVSGAVDFDRAVYETGLREPATTTLPTDLVYDLPDPGASEWATASELNGSVVEYHGALFPMRVIVEEVLVQSGESFEEGDLQRIRCIATAATGPGRLFVVSPSFRSEQDPDYQAWLTSTHFWGKVCRGDSVDKNINLEKGMEEILNLYRMNGVPTESRALTLISQAGTPSPYNGAAYAPLEGSDDGVLVRFHAEERGKLGARIDGVAESALASYVPGANRVIRDLPNRLVILDSALTGADINSNTASAAKVGVISGLFFLGLGGGWVYALRAQRRRREQFAEQQLQMLLAASGAAPADEQRYAA